MTVNAAPRPSRTDHLLLALAVVLGALPMIVLGRPELIGYDGFWHVFVARQDDWAVLWDEIRRNAHPPLFYLLLKAAIAVFGFGPVAYRLVAMAATVGSSWLVGRIVQRSARDRRLPAVAAFIFGSSLSTVAIALDVRSYAPCVLFMLWACLAFLDLAGGGFSAPDRRARVGFALAASLALLTHYVAVIFLAACLATAVVLVIVDREVRRRWLADGRRRWPANLATFGLPLAVLAVEYPVHLAAWTGRGFAYIPSFMFDPGRESALAFVWRNTDALFELFVPPAGYHSFTSTLIVTSPSLGPAAVAILVAFSLAAIAWLALGPARAGGGPATARRVPPILLLAMTVVLVAVALLGHYPWGGPLRHQFFLFPFAIVVLTLIVDQLAAGTRRWIRALAVGLFALAGLLNVVDWATHFRVTRGYLGQAEFDRFRELYPAPGVVLIDQFNLIQFFTHTNDRRWRFVRRVESRGVLDVWRVGDGGGAFFVCRDREQWLLDLSRLATYQRMQDCLETTGSDRLVVFRPNQRSTPVGWPLAETEAVAAAAAATVGIVPETVTVVGEGNIYASFVRRE